MLLGRAPAWAGDAGHGFGDNVQLRGSFNNARIKFAHDKKGVVAFIGGSITEMNGYRPMVSDVLKKQFPDTVFKFIDAGISSTCSTTGAFRLQTDVLKDEPVDLLFVEFAVNDDQDAGHSRAECIRGMEGMIRHARRQNPRVDIVITFFVNEGMIQTLKTGQTPLTIEAHNAVARYYDVPTINLAEEVAGEMTKGQLTWEKYGGVHPAPFGNAICTRMIEELFNRAWTEPVTSDSMATIHVAPAEPLDAGNYERGRFIDPKEAKIISGWTLAIPDWQNVPGAKRDRFTSIPMLSATEPGAQATLQFEGTTIGAFIVAGPDAGRIEASVDGSPYHSVDLFHRFSASLHYPRTVLFATDLRPGTHLLSIRLAAESKSSGHAARIIQFTAN